jgi:hypothetical protein
LSTNPIRESAAILLYNLLKRKGTPMSKTTPLPPWALMVGDALILLAVTLTGFANHSSSLEGGRWLTTYVPLLIAWGLLAPWLGNYRPECWGRPLQAWRALLAMVLAAPLAGFLRALMLNGTVIPIFVIALGGVSALAMTAWRVVWAWLAARGLAWTKLH